VSISIQNKLVSFVLAWPLASLSAAPTTIAASYETIAATFHAEGAEIYECKATSEGKLAWQPREPVATLLSDGKTVGRHYSGPNWEHVDGSALQARVIHTAPGPTINDLPLQTYQVMLRLGFGTLSGVTIIRRINAVGGVAQGPCTAANAFLSVPYRADYVFLRPAD